MNSILKGIRHSQLWSLNRGKWLEGPSIPPKYEFINACAVPLNSTTVIFVGVSITNIKITPETIDSIPNNLAITYNFHSNLWTEEESLNFPAEGLYEYYTYDFACTMSFGKTKNR